MADPFAYEEYRHQRIREKLDAERATRISVCFIQFLLTFHFPIDRNMLWENILF